MSLGRLDLKAGFSWGAAEGAVTILASLLSVVVVARIVGPHAFGLASLTFLIVSFAELLVFVPFVDALIQRRRVTGAVLDSAFTAMLVAGLAVFAGVCALGPVLARLLDAPELPWLLVVQASTCLLVALRGAGEAHLARGLFFKALAVRNILAKAASAGVAVALALAGAGAWSLVIGNVAYGLAATLAVLATLRRRPRWRLDLAQVRSLLGAGAFHLADALLSMGAPRLFGVLVGLLHGVGAAGQAAFAFRIVDTVAGLVSGSPLVAPAVSPASCTRSVSVVSVSSCVAAAGSSVS